PDGDAQEGSQPRCPEEGGRRPGGFPGEPGDPRGVPRRLERRQESGRAPRRDRSALGRGARDARRAHDRVAAPESVRPGGERLRPHEGRLRAESDGVLMRSSFPARNSAAGSASLPVMSKPTHAHAHAQARLLLAKDRPDWLALWALLGLGIVLLLTASFAGADEGAFTAKRTENFTATLSPRGSVSIENVSGDIVASPGKTFSAVVTTTVNAPTQSAADEALRRIRIIQNRDGDEIELATHWPDSHDFSFSRGR